MRSVLPYLEYLIKLFIDIIRAFLFVNLEYHRNMIGRRDEFDSNENSKQVSQA
jgi:hypothetical protein